MNDFTVIGKILKPQALKGEAKVSPITRDAMQFLTYKYLYIGEEHIKHDIDYCRMQDGFVIIKFHDINSAEMVDELRNELIYIDRSQLATLDSGEYFIQDLIGCEVVDNFNNTVFGVVTAVDEYSQVNTITMRKDNKEFLFPFLDKVISDVDVDNKKIYVIKDKLMEVLVDENWFFDTFSRNVFGYEL